MTRRTLTPIGLAGAALAAGLIACPSWTRAAGLDVWNLPELSRQCDEEAARREYLDDCRDDLWRRNAVKRAVAAEVAAGRLDLAGAAAEFLAAEEADPAALAALRLQFRDGPDLKRAARMVLAWMRVQPGQPAGEVARLEAEFRVLFPGCRRHPSSGGRGRVPDAPGGRVTPARWAGRASPGGGSTGQFSASINHIQ